MSKSKTIQSLAILKVNYDASHKDYIEIFLPFIIHLIRVKRYITFSIEQLKKDFEIEYGLILPLYPLKTMVNRMKSRGLVFLDNHLYSPVKSKIQESDFSAISKKQELKFNDVIKEFVEFSYNKYSISYNKTIAEEIILDYFKRHEIEALYAAEIKTILPDTNSPKSGSYIFAKFIKQASEDHIIIFEFIRDLYIGYMLATTVLYSELSETTKDLKNLNCYLDANIIFGIQGLSDPYDVLASKELISSLAKTGVKSHIFRHTYQEVVGILKGCHHQLSNNGAIEIDKSSRTLKHFLANGLSATDALLYINNLDEILQEFGIGVKEAPVHQPSSDYHIDEEALKSEVVGLYQTNPHFVLLEKEATIQRDIDSISAIFLLRKNQPAHNLRDSHHIFVTGNYTFAKSVTTFEKKFYQNLNISTCITDFYLGTLIWLRSPAEANIINTRKLMADSFAATNPDASTMRSYFAEADKLKNSNKITEMQYYALRSDISLDLLQEKITVRNEKITLETPNEILEEIKDKTRLEERKEQELNNIVQGSEKQKEIENLKAEIGVYKKKELQRETQATVKSRLNSKIFWGILTMVVLFAIYFFALKYKSNIESIFHSYRITIYIVIAFTLLATYCMIRLFLGRETAEKIKEWILSFKK
jgi:hypothetical protein